MFRFLSLKKLVVPAALAGAALTASAAPALAQYGAPLKPAQTKPSYSYRSGYSAAPRVYRYRSGYYAGGSGYARSFRASDPMRGLDSSGVVEQQNAYRRSFGKPF